MRTRVFAMLSGLLAVAIATAVGQDRADLRPLTAGPPDPAKGVADGEAAEAPEPVYYYNGEQKVYLFDTGFGVARVREGVEPAKSAIAPQVVDAPTGPMPADLVPGLRRHNLAVVRTRGPRAMGLTDAPPQDVEHLLPIVRESARPNVLAALAPAGGSNPAVMTPEISARFSDGVVGDGDADARRARVQEYVAPMGLEVVQATAIPNAYTLRLAEGPITFERLIGAANDLYEKGREGGEVLYAKPDFIRSKVPLQVQGVEDPRFENQWHLHNTQQGPLTGSFGVVDADVDAPEAWRITEGEPTIRVAIFDDSVERDHPDLEANYQAGRFYDGFALPPTFGDDPSPKDPGQRHGTACAGVAVAAANGVGVRGAAPRCGLIGVNFWYATDQQTAEAFYFCDDPDGDGDPADGASVISCSWGYIAGYPVPAEVAAAIDDLARNGRGGRGTVILFAAANNDGEIATHQQLGARESVICVGASNWRDGRAQYSNHGPELDVVAPSGDFFNIATFSDPPQIDTTDNEDGDNPQLGAAPFSDYSGYARGDYTGIAETGFSGTSSATPLAAGVCGLILSANPGLTSTQVRAILEHTCDRVRGEDPHPAHYDPTTSHDVNYGYGRINANRAVHVARSSQTYPDAVWPDHVQGLRVERSDSTARLSWSNPARNVAGVLVVRSDAPLSWRPSDGERYAVGDLVGGTGQVVSVARAQQFEEPTGGTSPHYAVFAFNGDHKYSWGQATRLEPVTPTP